jgi:hypothetical protein
MDMHRVRQAECRFPLNIICLAGQSSHHHIEVKGVSSMKFAKLLAIAALVSAFATASFAGSCCSKKKECAPKDGKTNTEKKEAPKQAEQPK